MSFVIRCWITVSFYYVALFTSCIKTVVGLNLVFGDTGGVVVVSLLCKSTRSILSHNNMEVCYQFILMNITVF
jgi:hypothetical protein